MESRATTRRKYRFGLFELDSASGELLRQGVRVKLQDQPFRLLTILLDRAGEVVSQEELRQQLWPADTFVEFDGSLKAALKRLRAALGDSADNPVFIETIPKRGYRFISPVSVEPEASHATGTASARPPISRGTFLVYAAVGIALLVTLAWVTFRRSGTASKSSSVVQAAIPVRKSVAVLGFHNASARPEDDWVATAFSEMLSTELGSGEKLRLVSGEEVANLRITSPWPQVGTLRRQTALRVGGSLNSDVLVLGSYTVLGNADRGQVRFDVSLQDGRNGIVITQIAQTGNRSDLFRLTSEIGAKLRERLGVPAIADAEEPALLASMPNNPDAARFYALGIAKLRDFDARAARDLLQQAIDADPKFPLGHSALAAALSELGYEQKRRDETKRAMDLSGNLPRTERLQVEGDYYESLPDHEKAAAAYSALFELFPDNIDYGLQLANAQIAANRKAEALETIARLRALPTPVSGDPRLDLAEAKALTADQWRDALALRRRAETKATQQGKKLIYANARLWECMGLLYGDHPDQVGTSCQEAYDTYEAAGNNLGAADALRLMADQQGGAGHIAEARATYERALKILAGQGENLKTATILNNMAIGYTNEGNLERGEELYRQAEVHFERGGDPRNTALALANLADIDYLRGNLPAAEKAYRQAIDITVPMEKADSGYAKLRLADLQLARGHVTEAHQLAARALDSVGSTKNSAFADATGELGDVLHTEGDLQGARQRYQASLEIWQTLGMPGQFAETQESLAELDIDQGHPDRGETLLRTAIAQFEKEKGAMDLISAYTLLSHILLVQGKLGDARKAIQHATELDRHNPDPALKLPVEIQTTRVDLVAAGPKPSAHAIAPAIERLRSTIATAQELGYYELECEARLELGQAQLKTNPEAGRSQLKILEEETHAHGLALLSSQVHQLLAPNALSANSAP